METHSRGFFLLSGVLQARRRQCTSAQEEAEAQQGLPHILPPCPPALLHAQVPFRHAAANLSAAQAEAEAQQGLPGFDQHHYQSQQHQQPQQQQQPQRSHLSHPPTHHSSLQPHAEPVTSDQPLSHSKLQPLLQQPMRQPRQQPTQHQQSYPPSSAHDHTRTSQPLTLDYEPPASPPSHSTAPAAQRSAEPRLQHSAAEPPRRSSAGLADIVRTKYVPLDDDSDSSDLEMEVHLMRKYGIK